MKKKKKVVFSILGSTKDMGYKPDRWERWRPNISLVSQEDILFNRIELFCQPKSRKLEKQICSDIKRVSPKTAIKTHPFIQEDPWDFEEVFGSFFQFTEEYNFNLEKEEYFIHVTTGTHVAQICLFLLTEARFFPGKIIQTSPSRHNKQMGTYSVIDLDLSKFDLLASRFELKKEEDLQLLKGGVQTKNKSFNTLIQTIEKIAVHSKAPILLTGNTGVGKSALARRIYQLKKSNNVINTDLVQTNCATIKGDNAMSTLFGHVKGAFTGAVSERKGLLLQAHEGLVFLDEIGELGLDEQSMLLKAIEEKTFTPLGSDKEVYSNFQLICGTNQHLGKAVQEGRFREDLLARINLWTFDLPNLNQRKEDIAPNMIYQLKNLELELGYKCAFNKEAETLFLKFAKLAPWPGNFRDFNSSLERLATLSGGKRIGVGLVKNEIERLRKQWFYSEKNISSEHSLLTQYLSPENIATIDVFDKSQLNTVIQVCLQSSSMAAAGRALFNVSRLKKQKSNDSDRLKKYLDKFGLKWGDLKGV